MTQPSVCIIDDDPGVRKAIGFVASSAGMAVKTYDCAETFLEQCSPDQTGCMVLDVRMPGLSGLQLQEKLTSHGIDLPIIFVTGHGTVPTCAKALRNGAVDFIEKPFDAQRLLHSIRLAMTVGSRSRKKRREKKMFFDRAALLTVRESEVMDLVIAGRSTKQIAAELDISIKTVDKHRAKVMMKMQIDNVAELVRLALTARDE